MAGRVNKKSTAIYSAQLVDESAVNVPLSSLVTFTLTLYDEDTGTIINSRNAQNILNANNVTVSATGAIVWSVQPDDNNIVSSASGSETRVALFQGTYGTLGAKAFKHEFRYRVVNLTKVS